MSSRVSVVFAVAALTLAACGHAPADGPDRRGPGGAPGEPTDGPPRSRQQVFVSPAGEPFRAPAGEAYPVAAWFAGADASHDGALSRDEFAADAARFFSALDTDHDGVLDGFEVAHYEKSVAPEILLGAGFAPSGARGEGGPGGGRRGGPPGGGRGPAGKGGVMGGALQGATPYSLLAEPQPVMGADADFNRRISRDEALKAARARFTLLDRDKDGVLRRADLPPTPVQGRGGPGGDPRDPGRERPRP